MQKTTTACSSTDERELGVGKQRGGGIKRIHKIRLLVVVVNVDKSLFTWNDTRYGNGGTTFLDLRCRALFQLLH